MDGVLGGNGDLQGLGIGVADIFGGKNNHPAGDEERILASFDHAHQPVKRGVGVTSAQAFDKCGNDVVMFLPGLVVLQRLFLQRFLHMVQFDAFVTRVLARENGGGFQRVQRDAAVSL